MKKTMTSSYPSEDVTLLLKDITGLVEPQSTQERENQIQRGRHYCEMLPLEYQPTEAYLQAYDQALLHFSKATADAVGRLAHKLKRSSPLVLVSLARAGIPAGILLKRYFNTFFGENVPHYAISIIRGRGIDTVAMDYLLSKHPPESLVFVDGWVGKGAIYRQLQEAVAPYTGVSGELAVLADPANLTTLYGTQEDLLIPSACLNATVSGLLSRSFLRDDIIQEGDFHGAMFYEEWAEQDLSNHFLQAVEQHFQANYPPQAPFLTGTGLEEVEQLAKEYQVADINLIKPSIGETTRVLLRRVPWKILVKDTAQNHPSLAHILQLAQERGVPVETRPLDHYLACGIIATMGDV